MFRHTTMNKAYILALAVILPSYAIAADTDSIHTWGAWAQNIQPAAGPVARVTPAPVIQPKVNFRPNENSAFTRTSTVPAASVVVSVPAPAVAGVAQIPGITIAPVDAPVISSTALNTGSAL